MAGLLAVGALTATLGALSWYLAWASNRLPPGAKLPPCGQYGDVDGDGYITQADVDMVADYLVGLIELSAEQLTRTDVNNDGIVDIGDMTLIAEYLSGAKNTFPVCGV